METSETPQATIRAHDYVKTGSDRSAGALTRAAAVMVMAILLPCALLLRYARTVAGTLRRPVSSLIRGAGFVGAAVTRAARGLTAALMRLLGRLGTAVIAVLRWVGAPLGAVIGGIGRAAAWSWETLTPIRLSVMIGTQVAIRLLSVPGRGGARLLDWCSGPLHVGLHGAWIAVRWVLSILRMVGRALQRPLAAVTGALGRTVGRAMRRLLTAVMGAVGRMVRLCSAPVRLAAHAALHLARATVRWAAGTVRLVGRASHLIGRPLAPVLAAVSQLTVKLLRRVVPVAAVLVAAAGRLLTPTGRGVARVFSFGRKAVLRVVAALRPILGRPWSALRLRIDLVGEAAVGLVRRTVGGARVAAGTARHRASRLAVLPTGEDWGLRADTWGSTSLRSDEGHDASFTLRVHENAYLRPAASTVSAVISIGSELRQQTIERPEMVEVILLDCSASMGHPWDKIINARRATHAAVASLPDGVWFAVVRGAESAEVAYPRRGGLARASDHTKREAFRAIAALQPVGGTAIGRWLVLARELVALRPGALGHALLLTDGKDEDETPAELQGALDDCEGAFQCDCRGIGTDWAVAELRRVSAALLGTVDIIREPAGLEADFRSVIEAAVSRGVEASIRIQTPVHATITAFRQVSPTVVDLTSQGRRIDAQTLQFRLGGWADEWREYHVTVDVKPAPVGCEMAACRLSIVVGQRVHGSGLVRAIWTDDPELAARLDPQVAHYTGQEELAAAVQEGLLARREGDLDTATLRLGQAVQLAASGGNTEMLSLLDKVVEVIDRDTGRVTLRRDVEMYDEMALDTRSTRTVPTPTTARHPVSARPMLSNQERRGGDRPA